MCCITDLPLPKANICIYRTTPQGMDQLNPITEALGKAGWTGVILALYPGEELTDLDDDTLAAAGLQRIPAAE